jgi:D-alanyl-D-alanine carboxypeptidase
VRRAVRVTLRRLSHLRRPDASAPVVAYLLLITAVVGMLSSQIGAAVAADLKSESAAEQVMEAVQWAQESRAAAAEQVAAGRRVEAAVHAGERARVAVDAARRERAERAARDAVRSALPGCEPGVTATFPNGQWPVSALCELPGGGHRLHPDAAEAYVRLSFAFAAAFGGPPCLTDSYRSYAEQRQVARTKPGLAARAGTSSHGDGQAVDLCGGAEVYGSPVHVWLRENGPRFGWDNPDWARADGDRPEPWHWEYTG